MCYTSSRMKQHIFPGRSVVLFCKPQHQAIREKISGVYAAATRCNWQVFQSEVPPTVSNIRKLCRMTNPVGILIDPLEEARPLPPLRRPSPPIVLLGRDNHRKNQIFDCSCQDSRQPVEAAIRCLDQSGDFKHFAFVGHPGHSHWSNERGELFRSHALKRGSYSAYSGPDPETSKGAASLLQWIKQLPKPCGLFLATDHLAASVFHAIHTAGLHIPEDIAVISVDNINQICLNVTPNLTSVIVNFPKAGENAIELLRRRLIDPKRPLEILTYGAIGVSNRASTRRTYGDRRVNIAVDFIAANACSRISSVHVAKKMGCCRRLAEQSFRKHTGKSILQAICAARIEKAKSLLSCDSIPLNDIPSFCGYDSPAFFKMLFHRETGMSMRDWKKAHSGE